MTPADWTAMPVDQWDLLFSKISQHLSVISTPGGLVAVVRSRGCGEAIPVLRLDYINKITYVNPDGVAVARAQDV